MRYLIAAAVLGLAGSAMAETWTVDDDGPADLIQLMVKKGKEGGDANKKAAKGKVYNADPLHSHPYIFF